MITKIIAGVDEVGRGPLAGPVVAAAVVLPNTYELLGLADSKRLSERQRENLYAAIYQQATAVAIGVASVAEIDTINIFHASLLAMQRALQALVIKPTHTQIDGKYCPMFDAENQAFIKGDTYIPAIMAASIIAKVTRDRWMIELEHQYPGYGFAQHKGYPTQQHLQALKRLGVTPIHRTSFAPVKACLS